MYTVSNNCVICTYINCRGGNSCRIQQILYKRKIKSLTDLENEILPNLDLSNLHLKSVPRDFFKSLTRLSTLNLSGNNFIKLPWWTFEHIESLGDLRLDNNTKLSDIYSALYLLRNLDNMCLRLTNCECIDYIRLLGMKTKWRDIILSGCRISKLPPKAFANMPALELLDLSKNKIKEFRINRDSFWHLDLSNNPIQHIDCVVEDLCVDSCGLTSLDGLLSPKTKQNLEMISLTNNHLRKLNVIDFSDLPKLVILGLSHNKIRDIEDNIFIRNPDLTDVYLDNNRISNLPEGFFTPTDTSVVNLSHNRLSYIHPNAFVPPRYDGLTLKLVDNPNLAFHPQINEFQSFSEFECKFLKPLFEAQELLEIVQKQRKLVLFREEFMMRLMAPDRIERLMKEYSMKEVFEVFSC